MLLYFKIKVKRRLKQKKGDPWSLSLACYHKVNTDGCWKSTNVASGGCIIRRDDGSWYIGYSFKFHAKDPAHAKLMVVRKGLELAKEFGIKKLQVEMDTKLFYK